MKINNEQFDRQISFFGSDGQKTISKVRVSVVGCGGLGSHLVQQLAYLGINNFVLADYDRVELSNLNRLIGANLDDVQENRLKVEVIQRMISFINSSAVVTLLPKSAINREGFELISKTDVIFGCVDSDAVRLVLTHLCSAYQIPYFDLSSDIINKGEEYGGRILSSINGDGCLFCMGELDQEEIRVGLSSKEDRILEDKIYGLNKAQLNQSGPAVVSINGTIASLAVTEFIVWKTGIRAPKRLIKYYGNLSQIRENIDKPQKNCIYCEGIYRNKDTSGLGRYLI